MAGVRGLLTRVARLEQARLPRRSPIEVWFGSFEAFETETQAEIDAGKLCPVDMPVILACLRQWHEGRVWEAWHQTANRVWETGR